MGISDLDCVALKLPHKDAVSVQIENLIMSHLLPKNESVFIFKDLF